MASLLSGKTRITLDNQYQGITVYEAPYVHISSTDKGKTYSISTDTAASVPTSCAKIDGYSKFEKLVPLATQSQEEKAMIEAAQDAERCVLDSAAMIQKVQKDAQSKIDAANHRFNQAILAYLHTGRGNVEATKVLEKAGVWATDDRTAAVACFELDKLYGVDTLETGV